MESKKINQLATELAPDLSDLTIIGDPTTGISKKITLSQMASLFTGTVEEYANFAAFPLVGVADTIYVAKDTNVIYRWDSTAYVVLSPNIIASLVFNDANGFDGNIALVGSVATLTITTALTTGSVGFIGASGALLQDNANFFWDDTNNRLGLGTNAPTTALDVFGSGIIGRINGTSTNNAYLGFASNGTNKWSAGNVQSDHRFRIFSEANSAELITILQTGEFGIGIANPLTKLHIDGGATALIANLDANVSVAKSVSFRSDNSSRINLEVSGTESGSNAGADFFIRRYSDLGALIDTPLTITRSTGAITLAGSLSGTSASFSSSATATAFIPSGATIPTNGMYLSAANTLNFATNTTNRLTITSAGNFGIGVIPSAWGSGYIGVQYGTAGSQMSVANNNRVGLNYYFDGTNFKAIQTGSSSFIEFDGDLINFRNAPSVSANATQTHSTRLLITSAGNVGIGVTPSSWGSGYIGFQYGTAGSQMSVANNNRVGLNYYFDGAAFKAIQTGAASLIEFDGDNIYFKNAASVSANAAQTLNTRLLITSGGNVLIGTSTDRSLKLVVEGTDNNNLMGSYNTTSGASLRMQSNQTINYIVSATNQLQFEVGAAIRMTIATSGAVTIGGSLSKGSGSFRIDHPLESMTETHQLVHSFVEAPQADLYYRGKIKLVNGKGQANIDEVATMTEGTFEALCREVQCFTTNESGWDLIKGKVIGNIIYIESQNQKSTDEISWLVIGERKDKHMMDTEWTDENGKVIVEPLKPIIKEKTIIEEEIIIEEENPIIKEQEVIIEEKEVISQPKTI